MAVNVGFYATMNELFARATNGTITNVVDYDTFVDAGKALASMNITDLVNGFLSPLMNKVQVTLNDNPSYTAALADMYAGQLDYGVLEMIMGHFYTSSAATFDGNTLVNGQTYTDQFTVHSPEKHVTYYTDSDSWQKTITIRDTDLKGAFTTPDKMDNFIASIFVDVGNSANFWKETNRLAALCSSLKPIVAGTPETADENNAANYYNLLTIFNTKMGTAYTTADCLYKPDFVRFAVATIRDIYKLMEKPSDKFSGSGSFDTFTPESHLRLRINSIFDKAIRTAVIDAYNKEYGMIEIPYEVLPYWQNITDRLRFTTNTSGTTTYSPYIIAVLQDKRAVGEMLQLEDVATDRNGMRHYTNYHYCFNYMYWRNADANTVVFTIG